VSVFKTFLLHPNAADGKKRANGTKRYPPGAKVDVVADNGRCWIRVNTYVIVISSSSFVIPDMSSNRIKNSRLLAEFREIDSYVTDSEEDSNDEWDNEQRPTLSQTEFDNSVLRMGRSLLAAAKANPIGGTTDTPVVLLRLTRLNPDLLDDNGGSPDPRIRQTVDMLWDMGIKVVLGERPDDTLPTLNTSPSPSSLNLRPTSNINLDLSVLIALISDLTHAPLPQSIPEANKRFMPPPEYREWKQQRTATIGKKPKKTNPKSLNPGSNLPSSSPGMENDINDLPKDLIKHARQLTNQLLQETSKGLLQEIRNRFPKSSDEESVKFWTTSEARDRCLRIVWKIGGVQEKRRVQALFQLPSDAPDTTPRLSLAEAEQLYWQDSRFPRKFIPLLPIHILPESRTPPGSVDPKQGKSRFALELAKVCSDILSQETASIVEPDDALDVSSTTFPSSSTSNNVTSYSSLTAEEIQRARFTKANPRLTTHTVQTMQWGATLGWTILTANRTSVKAILKELKGARIAGRLNEAADVRKGDDDIEGYAAIWIVDPRSLAEGMSSLSVKS